MDWFVVFCLAVGLLLLSAFSAQMWQQRKKQKEEEEGHISSSLNEEEMAEETVYKFDFEYKERDKYLELIEEGVEDKKVLGAALLKRAIEAVEMGYLLHKSERDIIEAHRKGYVKPKEWETFQTAQREVNLEFNQIPEESDKIKEDWSKTIFDQALLLAAHVKQKQMQQQWMNKMIRKQKRAQLKKEGKLPDDEEEEDSSEEEQENKTEAVQGNEEKIEENTTPTSSPKVPQLSPQQQEREERAKKLNLKISQQANRRKKLAARP